MIDKAIFTNRLKCQKCSSRRGSVENLARFGVKHRSESISKSFVRTYVLEGITDLVHRREVVTDSLQTTYDFLKFN